MSKKINVLLLGHKSQAGKDTVGEFLKELGFVRAAFADKLKSTVADLYDFSHDQMYGSLKDVPDVRYPNFLDSLFMEKDVPGLTEKEIVRNPNYNKHLTPRRILQVFGQQQRSIFPDIWAAYVFNSTIPSLLEQGHSNIVITDFRFKNEASVAENWAKQDPENRSLLTVKVYRPGVVAASGPEDVSEKDLDDYDFHKVLVNGDGLGELKENARKVATDFLNE